MDPTLDELDRQKESETWRILAEEVPALEEATPPLQIELNSLFNFSPPIHEILATHFLRLNRLPDTAGFMTDEQLTEIASEEMVRGRERLETDIDESPDIYIFVSLVDKQVLKVGQAENFRKRFAKSHLRYGDQRSKSELIFYCKSRWGEEAWPQCLKDEEFTALLFPMYRSDELDRRFLEDGLKALLSPLMP